MAFFQIAQPTDRFKKLLAFWGGPLSAIIISLFVELQHGQPEVTQMLAIAVWMAIWWVTEIVPLAVTALLPVVLFPLLHIMPGQEVATKYINSVIFLFMGGFMIAIAMQRWMLHKRIALLIIDTLGISPKRLYLGFMAASAFLSMWISNTATAMMMLPIALAVITNLEEQLSKESVSRFGIGLLLAIAYAASIGGVATLIGTPPNMIFKQIYAMQFETAPEISFSQWMLFALPLTLLLLLITWGFLVWKFCFNGIDFNVDQGLFQQQRKSLGRMKYEEKWVLVIFALTALLWLTRSDLIIGTFTFPGWGNWFLHTTATGDSFSLVDDGTVAIGMALLLFFLPAKDPANGKLLRWEDLRDFPWGILWLFGGGFALAAGVMASGLSECLGSHFAFIENWPPLLITLFICLGMTFLTEFTSNTASTQMILPILATLAVTIHVPPMWFMIPATIAASCAFMLPVATPPNAIVFGSERLKISDMTKSGIFLNLIGAVITALYVYFLGRLFFE